MYAPAYTQLQYPPDCPFQTERIPLARRRLASLGLLRAGLCREVAPAPAPRAVLAQFHSTRYLDELERAVAGDNTVRGWALAWRTLCGAGDGYDLTAGLGGVLLESTEWAGGLQDRALPVTDDQRRAVDPAVDQTIATIQRLVFPRHRLEPEASPPCRR